MPETVNSYVKQSGDCWRDEWGDITVLLTVPVALQAQGCLGDILLCIFSRGYFPECF